MLTDFAFALIKLKALKVVDSNPAPPINFFFCFHFLKNFEKVFLCRFEVFWRPFLAQKKAGSGLRERGVATQAKKTKKNGVTRFFTLPAQHKMLCYCSSHTQQAVVDCGGGFSSQKLP